MNRTLVRRLTPADVRLLIGSGDKIMMFFLPFLAVGLVLAFVFPSVFDIGRLPTGLRVASIVVLLAGIAVWAWCVGLIVTRVPRGELITTGPYAVVKHPLYTAVALLVLPSIGFLADTWLGAALGLVMYAASRRFARAEETRLAKDHGQAWTAYTAAVKIPWL
jgi:protein-S-isoprenylcysteine O-methyltransferase Ste14